VKLTSILAIYLLFWALCLFVVMPWHVRTAEDVGEKVQPGHAESAPYRVPAAKIVIRTTLLSALLFGLFYANYLYGWLTVADLDWMH
jgi:predicted secreted protein